MSASRLLLLIVFPAMAGLWIGLSVHGITAPALLGSCRLPADAFTPPVGASNEWGQHTPREAALTPIGVARVEQGSIRANVPTDFNPDVESPRVASTSFLDRMSSVIGNVQIGENVFVAPFASIRGDEGQPIHVGNDSSVQDGAVIHALETSAKGEPILANRYEVNGAPYAVFVGERVTLGHQAQVHGPAWIEDDTFIGMQALVFRSHVGKGGVIEPAAKIIGVKIAPGRYVPAGSVITTQTAADALPEITFSYGLREINQSSVRVNTALAESYGGRAPAAPAAQGGSEEAK